MSFSPRSLVLGCLILSLAIDAPLVHSQPLLGPRVVLRIEGKTGTIFEGGVRTRGHPVSTASSNGFHPCDGTNNGANTVRGPTATTALDDASRRFGRYTWDGTFSD